MNTKINETNRALAMKEYFTREELDIIHHALDKYYTEDLKGNFTGYSIATDTLKLKEIFARQ
jgi:vacuolar-type H+-ATPase subunit C/Vma6